MHTWDITPIGPAAPGVTEVELDGQVCLYSPVGEQLVVLNGTASDVWRLADGNHTLGQVVGLLAGVYGCEPESIADDVLDAVQAFDRAHLLETD